MQADKHKIEYLLCNEELSNNLKDSEIPIYTKIFKEMENRIKASIGNKTTVKNKPLNTLLDELRQEIYSYLLDCDSKAISQEGDGFRCMFEGYCDKKLKGKGNLRRHLEWHVQKIEESCVRVGME